MSFDTGTFKIGDAIKWMDSLHWNTPSPFDNTSLALPRRQLFDMGRDRHQLGTQDAQLNHLHLGHLEHHIDKVQQQYEKKIDEMNATFKIVLTECFAKLEGSVGEVNNELKALSTRIDKLEQQVLAVQEELTALSLSE